MFPTIQILLSTYNGGRYLQQQLESIFAQTRQDFELLVRDDGSTDDTQRILETFATKYAGRLRIVDPSGQRLGPAKSFGRLMFLASAPYLAFCDQDDFWFPEKIARQVVAIQEQERQAGCNVPVLCCSDALITDAQLQISDGSYFAKHDISVYGGRDLALSRLVFRNYAIGATTMINIDLARRIGPIPDAAIMHDWWCALVAALIGRTVVVREPQVLYRQHDQNVVGSKLRRFPVSRQQVRAYLEWSKASVAGCVNQAIAARNCFLDELGPDSRRVLDQFVSFGAQSALQRIWTVAQTRAFKPGIALNSLHLYACMTARV